MKEYPIGIHTNAWNAIRYTVITLALVPLAEKIWAVVHAKRTGQRVLHGSEARLRQSKLAHWGLHQEVDEKSRLSRISTIAVCVLHIAGALLIEYGSGSTGSFKLHDAVLSRALRDDSDLGGTGTFLVDASYVYSQLYGSTDCIDGGPRKMSDFGLRVVEKPAFTFVSRERIPFPNLTTDRVRRYLVGNSGKRFLVYGNGRSRWYALNHMPKQRGAPDVYLGFANETACCVSIDRFFLSCSKIEDLDSRNLLSAALAIAAVPGVHWTNRYLVTNGTALNLNLSRVSVVVIGERGPLDAKSETTWIRNGMPPKKIPTWADRPLHLNITGLHHGCRHRHAVYVSDVDKLSGLKVSNVNFSVARQAWIPANENHKLVLRAYGNYITVGTVVQVRSGYCYSAQNYRLCITRLKNSKHELSFYIFDVNEILTAPREMQYKKKFTCSVEGTLSKTDVLNIAVQSLVEATRVHPVSLTTIDLDEAFERVIKLIVSGRVYSRFVRVLGTQVYGKSVLRSTDMATINVLGVVGFVILTLLVAVPVPMLFYYRTGIRLDVESSFRRAVLEINGIDSLQEVHNSVPGIAVRDEGDGKLKHTFTM